jgi:hypothetical protein
MGLEVCPTTAPASFPSSMNAVLITNGASTATTVLG